MDTKINEFDGGIDIKCRNFEICNQYFHIQMLQCRSGELCINCDMGYSNWKDYRTGILQFNNDTECPICLEIKRCVKMINCDHYVCIDDFKRMHYGETRENEPVFPYSEEIEIEYSEDPMNLKWEKEYPLIELYNESYRQWDEQYDKKYYEEENLRKCPLCRS